MVMYTDNIVAKVAFLFYILKRVDEFLLRKSKSSKTQVSRGAQLSLRYVPCSHYDTRALPLRYTPVGRYDTLRAERPSLQNGFDSRVSLHALLRRGKKSAFGGKSGGSITKKLFKF